MKYEDGQKAFERLLQIMDELRLKCPWDKKQTLESLRHLTIEEVYELSDSIIEKDMDGIEEELGDLLLHMVFYAKIGSETNDFDIASVIHKVCDKLVQRHPHIYGDVVAETESEVKQNWEQLKLREGKNSILEGVPRSLPSMVKAYRIQEKVTQVGFDWEEPIQVYDKVREELKELQDAFENGDKGEIENEFGDLMFSMIN
ncbi:MAG: nucleoside triphosphate pyrophosphohydrolase, partial [Chitinophagales bacterium]|nr:nucleoside triphosphate pyrophosphohydrolase [Chitinophagales bacterium]